MPTLTHVAGVPVQFGSYLRQRCSWCGYVIIDQDLSRISVLIADADKPFGTWEVGALIEIEASDSGRFMQYAVIEPEMAEDGEHYTPPENCCMRVPPELTLAVELPYYSE